MSTSSARDGACDRALKSCRLALDRLACHACVRPRVYGRGPVVYGSRFWVMTVSAAAVPKSPRGGKSRVLAVRSATSGDSNLTNGVPGCLEYCWLDQRVSNIDPLPSDLGSCRPNEIRNQVCSFRVPRPSARSYRPSARPDRPSIRPDRPSVGDVGSAVTSRGM